MELPDCPNCELAGALCEYHVREELAGTRLANEDLHKRIKELKAEVRCLRNYAVAREQRIEELAGELFYIREVAHQHSTGPEHPDVLWNIRNVAYKALGGG